MQTYRRVSQREYTAQGFQGLSSRERGSLSPGWKSSHGTSLSWVPYERSFGLTCLCSKGCYWTWSVNSMNCRPVPFPPCCSASEFCEAACLFSLQVCVEMPIPARRGCFTQVLRSQPCSLSASSTCSRKAWDSSLGQIYTYTLILIWICTDLFLWEPSLCVFGRGSFCLKQ